MLGGVWRTRNAAEGWPTQPHTLQKSKIKWASRWPSHFIFTSSVVFRTTRALLLLQLVKFPVWTQICFAVWKIFPGKQWSFELVWLPQHPFPSWQLFIAAELWQICFQHSNLATSALRDYFLLNCNLSGWNIALFSMTENALGIIPINFEIIIPLKTKDNSLT